MLQKISKNLHRKMWCLLAFMFMVSIAYAKDETQVQLNVEKITENISIIFDQGNGNTLMFAGEDGVLIIDTKSGPAIEKLIAKIAEISDKPIRYAINTHWHYDHVGGNELMGKAGATIIAHENVRKRMNTEQKIKFFNKTIPPSPEKALPSITYTKKMAFHLNGKKVSAFHLGPGHTGGDTIVYFRSANVIHLGDLYFKGLYPYIGISSGGSIKSMIKVGNKVLAMIDEKTIIVPGHGPLSNKAEYAEYLNMLTEIKNNVSKQIKAGKSQEEITASKPTKKFDSKWGKGFLGPDVFTGLVYMDLSRK
ncbi:MAG: MBL fold metallo-hydrolase [Desulfobacterales bacterium]|jgi:cyclase|nr:MBL fold metallo-hydrolase [Desulfobacteraceae bacterium]MBT4365524.1 MBL fold metallo-hydrolase [Desulfobacteraceae bacterium]MBT7698112.1 MBL fold metallo-hydrolase [Desulfobacterales bacterium]